MTDSTEIIEADLTWIDGRFERDVRVEIGADGRITRVGRFDDPPDRRLKNRALLPGMINAHSHAFQRGLRGRGETFPDGAGSFWSWRQAMYTLVDQLDAEQCYELSHRAFAEMRSAGITTVGEFHYIHHDASQAGYAFDEVVLRAARDAGIRIVLLNAYYATGGIGAPLEGGQLRFRTDDRDEYWAQQEALASTIDQRTQSLGVVGHSIRAVPIDDLAALHAEASRRGMVFHMHIEEQPAEIKACEGAYDATPMALINEHIAVNDRTTMVHCTHTKIEELQKYLDAGGRVCLCPLTEANLGDGLADVPQLLTADGRICLGTDSNARISMLEEMRLLEYGQRLKTQSRGVVRDDHGRVAERLMQCATVDGAASLGVDAGSIEPGKCADFAVVDLNAPSLAGWSEDTLLASLIFGGRDDVIDATCVSGHWQQHR